VHIPEAAVAINIIALNAVPFRCEFGTLDARNDDPRLSAAMALVKVFKANIASVDARGEKT
jgi:hypothetical protein